MKLRRIIDPDEMTSGHVALLVLVFLALAGNCWLTSAGKPRALPAGALQWDPDSLLLAVVEVLDLNYAQPTPNGVAVKALVHGVASGAGLLLVGFLVVGRARAVADAENEEQIAVEDLAGRRDADGDGRQHLNPISAAQGLMVVFLAWAMLSSLWSHAPGFSWGAAVLLAGQVAWALILGWGLNRRAAIWAAQILLGVLGVTGLLALLYHNQRIPTLRASYPIGNPLMLAGCLLVGVLIALHNLFIAGRDLVARRYRWTLVAAVGALIALPLMLLAMRLADSRAAIYSLIAGLVAVPFFALGRKGKLLIVALAALLAVAGGSYFWSRASVFSPSGRDATIRVRMHAWGYAIDLMQQSPIRGNGQGTYALLADALATDDVLRDPEALEARISHAHNEWLEIAADLGSVGLVLLAGALALTMLGGARAVSRLTETQTRWTLIGLLACFVALLVDASAGVGLRIEGLPLIYYTVLGLIWAMLRPTAPTSLRHLGRSRIARIGTVALGIILGIGIIESARRDFSGARAMYDTQLALQQGDWDKAERLCTRGPQLRLSPQRRLLALLQQARTYLFIADYHREQLGRRVQMLQQMESPDEKIARSAQQSRILAEQYALAGLGSMQAYLQTTPSMINAGASLYGLHQLLAELAELFGNPEKAGEHRVIAAKALADQLDRQPFEASLSAAMVDAAGDALAPEERLLYLARPLRYGSLSALHLQLLERMAADPDGVNAFERLDTCAEAASDCPETIREPARQWMPELRRMRAVVASLQGDYATAAAQLASACEAYDQLAAPARLAQATSQAELADAIFFENPGGAERAIEAAEKALELVPPSTPGRELVALVRDRLVFYHLAADHEEFARQIIAQHVTTLDEKQFETFIAQQYASLALFVMERVHDSAPGLLDAWLQRSRQLAPDDPTAYVVAAERALVRNSADDFVAALEESALRGAAPAVILDLVERGLLRFEGNETLIRLRQSIRRRVEGSDEATDDGSIPPPAGATAIEPTPATEGGNVSVTPPDSGPVQDAAASSNGLKSSITTTGSSRTPEG